MPSLTPPTSYDLLFPFVGQKTVPTSPTALTWLIGTLWHKHTLACFQQVINNLSPVCAVIYFTHLWITMIDWGVMEDDQLWRAALGQLELKVSQGNFLAWFRQTRIKERKDSLVLIETDNPFAFEWLSKKYRTVILEVLQNLDQQVQELHFQVSSAAGAKKSFRKNLRILVQKNRPVSSLPLPTRQAGLLTSVHGPTHQILRSPTAPAVSKTLNPKYTFATFVTGPSNEIAHAACQAIATTPGVTYNPLFIYGGVGLGKTHLLQAVGNALLAANPHYRVLYVSSEKFMNEFVESIRNRTQPAFRRGYREVDILILDDIQFLAGRGKTQEELFHTFNTLHGANKQVILSSDRPPSAIPTLEERLSSRLGGGMIVDIKKPDYETRLAIVRDKASARHVEVADEVLMFIAKNIQNNVRELESTLNRVLGYCEVHAKPATLTETKTVLEEILAQSQHKAVGSKQILEAISGYYNLPLSELSGKCRKKEIVRPRQIAMYLLRKESNMSFPSIGEYFGGRDHTTAMHACEKIEKLLEHDEELVQELNFLRERLYV